MDFKEKICKVCGDIKKLINCPHTHPLCLYKNSILTGVMPFSHPLIASETEPKPSGTQESKKRKVKKPTKPAEPGKLPKPTEDHLLNSWVTEFHPRPVHHRCLLTGRKRPVSTSISSETEADSSAEELEIDQQLTPTHKRAKRVKIDGKRHKSDRFEMESLSTDQTGKNSRKRHRLQDKSDGKEIEVEPADNLYQHWLRFAKSYDLIREFYELLDLDEASQVSTPTADDNGAVQQANLPISSTATQENSAEKQMELGESGNDVDNNNFDSVAITNESAKSDSSAEPNIPLPTTRRRADDITLVIRKLADQIDKTSPSQLLPEIIDLMRNHIDNVRVLLDCDWLIGRYYSFDRLRPFGSSLIGKIIDILLSTVKHHCDNNEIVTKFCHSAKRLLEIIGVGPDRCQIDWFMEAIDFLLEIGCGENWLGVKAKKSTLELLEKIIDKSDADQIDSIGQKLAVEKMCQSIGDRLERGSELEPTMLLSLSTCLCSICGKSVANQKRFLNAEGLCLIKECLELRDTGKSITSSLRLTLPLLMMKTQSEEKSILPDLMADGNREVLWEIWTNPQSHEVGTFCHRIFANFITESPENWPFAQPTLDEVKMQLKEEQLKAATDADLKMSELSDQFDESLAVQQLPKIIDLMRNNFGKGQLLVGCERLINRYSFDNLSRLESPLIGSLIDILRSVAKGHRLKSVTVDKFCRLAQLLLERIGVDRGQFTIDWFLESIDFILDIGCGRNRLGVKATKSTLKLLDKIIEKSDADQIDSLGRKLAVEKIGEAIRNQLEIAECDEIFSLRGACLHHICAHSVANQKRFLNAGGLCLIKECWKQRHRCGLFAKKTLTMMVCRFMEEFSSEKSILPDLMTNGNPEIVWQMWNTPKPDDIRIFCRRIFANFICESSLIWPFEHPTAEEVKMQLKKDQLKWPDDN